ncbi:Mannosyl-oligosaccharide glucosidase GCS1 [Linum grandiflorum]
MTGSSRRSARSSRGKYSSDGGDDDDVSRRSSRHSSKSRRDNRRRDGSSSSLIRMLNVDLKVMMAVCGAASLIIFFLIYNLMIVPGDVSQRPSVVTPFPSPKLMELPQFQGEHKESLYWGTYRPQVYFGVRARTPRSLVAGLMWLGVKDGRYDIRHVCQNSDDLSKYGWIAHNGRDFGKQELVEQELKLETSFLKSRSHGSGYGGDWAVQIDVQHEKSGSSNELLTTGHLFFYLADESGSALSLSKDANNNHETSLLASGSRADVGEWQVHLNSKDTLEVHHSGFRTPYIHNLSDLVLQDLAARARDFGRLQLPDSAENSANILVFQVSARIPFRTDIVFVSGTGKKDSRLDQRVSSLTGASLSSQLKQKQTEFDSKFEQLFDGGNKLETESTVVGKAAIANMLGGIGYFYGQSKIAYPNRDTFISYWPAELYTAVPSRPFFPRGFLWDEGFHQLLIWRWDLRISLDIVGHWLDLMNIDGWIPREQILGSEARSKVPEEFIPQYPSNGNPPTLFLVINDLLDGIEKNLFTNVERRDITLFLERAFVRLEAWYQWFDTTQSGKQTSSYFWHGRDNRTTRELNPKTLSSGLDDYPRASHPNDDERHVDLRCWMLLAARCMQSIAKFFENGNSPGKEYASTVELLSDLELLNEMHLDPTSGAYSDFGNHTEKVRLSWKVIRDGNNHARRELVREVLETPELRLVPHVGFVSLFPFMGKIIPPDSWILEKQLDMISNRSVLWSSYGLRSLARTSSIYMKRNTEHDAPYWRGPIWMNMNYMALSALHHYSQVDGPYRERAGQIYRDLRSNLIRNVVHNYHQTGYLWEQYDQMNGKGQGTRLFTGWTALVLLIMGEAYT